ACACISMMRGIRCFIRCLLVDGGTLVSCFLSSFRGHATAWFLGQIRTSCGPKKGAEGLRRGSTLNEVYKQLNTSFVGGTPYESRGSPTPHRKIGQPDC